MMASVTATARPGTVPVPYRVVEREAETPDTATIVLEPVGARPCRPSLLGSSRWCTPSASATSRCRSRGIDGHRLTHTVRAVGAVSGALYRLRRGDTVGVRGPFGTGWELPAAAGSDLLVVAGGIGLAPLRPLVRDALAAPERYGRLNVLIGARTPRRPAVRRGHSTAGRRRCPGPDHRGPRPTGGGRARSASSRPCSTGPPSIPAASAAFVCGPEAMIRATARELVHRGVDPERIRVSLERNMHCATGHCGHCQLGPLLLCRDGPVVSWSQAPTPPHASGSCDMTASRPSRSSPSGSSPPATAASSPCWTARTNSSASPRGWRSPTSWRRPAPTAPGPYDLSLVEGSVTTQQDVDRIQHIRAVSRRLVTIGACATAGGVQALRNYADVAEFQAVGLRPTGLHRDARHLHTHQRPCPGRLRTARLPHRPRPADGGHHRLPGRPQARRTRAQRLLRVQAARHGLRDRRPRHALPGSGHPRRMRCALPRVRARLLRLLRPVRTRPTSPRSSRCCAATAWTLSTWCGCCAPSIPPPPSSTRPPGRNWTE